MNATTDVRETNRAFYEPLWREVKLVPPERFNTWPLVTQLVQNKTRRLEVGPGMRPRLPIADTDFLDLCEAAVTRLNAHGARAVTGSACALPYADASFDVVCAFDIVEHVEDDDAVLRGLARVLAQDGTLLLAVPLHMARWIPFDDVVGHCRRYKPAALMALLSKHGFQVQRSAAYGMQPSSVRLMSFAMWWLRHLRGRALFFFNHFFVPITLRRQPKLVFSDGMLDATNVDEVLLVCRRAS